MDSHAIIPGSHMTIHEDEKGRQPWLIDGKHAIFEAPAPERST